MEAISIILFLLFYPVRWGYLYYKYAKENRYKVPFKSIGIVLGTLAILLWLTNPSESQFRNYVEAHATYKEFNQVRATREYTFIIGSMFFTRGRNDRGYYLGIFGAFYHWAGNKIEDIDYAHNPNTLYEN